MMATVELLRKLGLAVFLVESVFVCWGVIFLARESRRRHLYVIEWLGRLPPSMAFMIATLTFDIGVIFLVCGLAWRSSPLLVDAGAALTAVGALCKIRSVTMPDYGHIPWLICLTAVALVFLLI